MTQRQEADRGIFVGKIGEYLAVGFECRIEATVQQLCAFRLAGCARCVNQRGDIVGRSFGRTQSHIGPTTVGSRGTKAEHIAETQRERVV